MTTPREKALELVQELLDMANRHWCGECGGFLSSELDFVTAAEKAITALQSQHHESAATEGAWKTAGEISEAAKKRYDELSYKEWDWRSFHNGFLEGAEATLQRGRDQTGNLREVGATILAANTDAPGSDVPGLSEEMATQVRLYKASGGTDVARYVHRLTERSEATRVVSVWEHAGWIDDDGNLHPNTGDSPQPGWRPLYEQLTELPQPVSDGEIAEAVKILDNLKMRIDLARADDPEIIETIVGVIAKLQRGK